MTTNRLLARLLCDIANIDVTLHIPVDREVDVLLLVTLAQPLDLVELMGRPPATGSRCHRAAAVNPAGLGKQST
ncbi:MAG: hypothetical protein IT456_21910 [Planctomycetes bacterium]|nr:hypothetical protein [Planctomycetota bacterium]